MRQMKKTIKINQKKQETLSALPKAGNSSSALSGFGAKNPTGTFDTAKPTDTFGTAKPTGIFGTAKPTDTFGTAKPTDTFGTAKPTGTFGTAKLTGTFGTAKPTDKLDNKGLTKPSPNTSVRNNQDPNSSENKSMPQIDVSSNPIETPINSAFPDATADRRKQLLAQFSMIYPYNYGMCNPMYNPMYNPMQMPMYQFGFPYNGIYFVPSFEHSIMIPGNGFTTRQTIWVPFIPYNYQQYKSLQQCTNLK